MSLDRNPRPPRILSRLNFLTLSSGGLTMKTVRRSIFVCPGLAVTARAFALVAELWRRG